MGLHTVFTICFSYSSFLSFLKSVRNVFLDMSGFNLKQDGRQATCWKRSALPVSACSSVTRTTDSTPCGNSSSRRGASCESARTTWKFNWIQCVPMLRPTLRPGCSLARRLEAKSRSSKLELLVEATRKSKLSRETSTLGISISSYIYIYVFLWITKNLQNKENSDSHQQRNSFGFGHVAKSHKETTFTKAIWERQHRGHLGLACNKTSRSYQSSSQRLTNEVNLFTILGVHGHVHPVLFLFTLYKFGFRMEALALTGYQMYLHICKD